MLLTHGARSVLHAAAAGRAKGREVHAVRHWALEMQGRSNHYKATCALANRLARICYATLRDKKRFDEEQPAARKTNRQEIAMPA
jgi:transposase